MPLRPCGHDVYPEEARSEDHRAQEQAASFEYLEVDGKPQEDVTSLIRPLLAEYSAKGGEVFDVQERKTANGSEWNVIPLKARSNLGSFSDQPDIWVPLFR